MFWQNKRRSRLGLSKPRNKAFSYYNELLAIILLAFSIFLFVAFYSYNPTDSSCFYFCTDTKPILNWTGIIGANAAASFFYFFGSAAYLFIALFLFLVFLFFKRKDIETQWPKFVGFVFLLLSITTLFRMYKIDFTKSFPGGLLGDSFYNFIFYFIGFCGTNIFVFSLLFISIVIIFNISIFTIMTYLVKLIWMGTKFAAISAFRLFTTLIKYIFNKIIQIIVLVFTSIGRMFKNIFANLVNFLKKKFKKNSDNSSSNSGSDSMLDWNDKKHEEKKKEEPKDKDDIWQSLQNISDTYDLSTNSEQSVFTQDNYVSPNDNFKENNLLDLQKFENKKTFNDFYFKGFLRYKFLSLPNTIFNKNILTKEFITKLSDALNAQEENKRFQCSTPKVEYTLPDLDIFKLTDSDNDIGQKKVIEEECIKRGEKLEEKLRHFGIKGKITAIRPGPVITLFEYKPDIDSKISKIVSLEDDLAMALTAISIRIVAPIPGKSVVGFEISNRKRENVYLADVLLSDEFKKFSGKLPLNLGVDLVGNPVIEDLVKMPHLLVAGSTGSGKSVGLNAMLAGFLCHLKPDQLKIILIDPKRLEFSPYADIPHLLFPIITNPRKAAPVLKWLVQEMEDRYDKMAQAGVRNIAEYQKLVKRNSTENMPFIVLMIDELADLMMVAGKDVEMQIARIAQMARAAGIHMIVATQRPSVDVVTGLIKVNFPSRVAYRVSSKIDSRTIIDSSGAEKLLGRGDLLYMNSTSSDLKRIHGAYISEKEIEDLTAHLYMQAKPEYLDLNEALRKVNQIELNSFEDELYPEVIEFVRTRDEISISMLQRYYKIGFNRSAKIIERLELDGLIAPAQGSKPRKVLRS
ncbi:DNA translocase FtsK [Candidatus Dependentiae bacterium]